MRCERVSKQLSCFLDDVLGPDQADAVALHLEECSVCCREFNRLKELRRKLRSLETVEPPEYLRHLVELQIDTSARESWRDRLRGAFEYRLSRIRTTERIWYLTRVLGTATTFLLFFAISASMNPLYLGFQQSQWPERNGVLQVLPDLVLKRLGIRRVEDQKRRTLPSEPQINGLYFVNFGENASRTGQDDNLSVVAVVDRSGTAKIQNVLEYPADSSLLAEFNTMLTSARCRPATQNGRAVEGHLVLAFSKVTVYE